MAHPGVAKGTAIPRREWSEKSIGTSRVRTCGRRGRPRRPGLLPRDGTLYRAAAQRCTEGSVSVAAAMLRDRTCVGPAWF